jgi:hypothetical protein
MSVRVAVEQRPPLLEGGAMVEIESEWRAMARVGRIHVCQKKAEVGHQPH